MKMTLCCFGALLSVEGEEEEIKSLLELLVDHYITVRRFSFASGLVEKYKQDTRNQCKNPRGFENSYFHQLSQLNIRFYSLQNNVMIVY